ncbi:2505_t:CDS:2, partial [Cetraspora pellucida]
SPIDHLRVIHLFSPDLQQLNSGHPPTPTQISITTYVNQHNHALFPETQSFGVKYQMLSKEVLDEINIMTKHDNLSLMVQKSLLKARFPNLNFQD